MLTNIFKIFSTIFLAILGATLGSFFYNTQISKIPIGIFISLLLLYSLSNYIKIKYSKKYVYLFALFSIFTIIFFCGPSPFGDDVVIYPDIYGYLWLFCGSIVNFLPLFFNKKNTNEP
jgi:hypothetical protein